MLQRCSDVRRATDTATRATTREATPGHCCEGIRRRPSCPVLSISRHDTLTVQTSCFSHNFSIPSVCSHHSDPTPISHRPNPIAHLHCASHFDVDLAHFCHEVPLGTPLWGIGKVTHLEEDHVIRHNNENTGPGVKIVTHKYGSTVAGRGISRISKL